MDILNKQEHIVDIQYCYISKPTPWGVTTSQQRRCIKNGLGQKHLP